MKSRKLRKFLMMLASALLLVSVTVGATVAYLTSTDEVVNTFTVGNVGLTLDEADVNTDGTYVSDINSRVDANEYHLLPGKTYIKDPTVHITEGSENGWLFVKITNEIAQIEKATTIADQMTANGWALVSGETDVYAYNAQVVAGRDYVVFENFSIKDNVTKEALAAYANKTVKIQAYMVQAEGFATSAEAWSKAPCAAWTTTTPAGE